MTDPCVVCSQNSEIKVKPGIFPCLGCKQTFCTKHVAVHRQELTNELDILISERNELQDLFDHQKDLPNMTFHMDFIDEWVKKTINQVYQAADKARECLTHIAQAQRRFMDNEVAELSKQLNDMRENENFFEQDIAHMKNECSRLKAAINQVNIEINTADIYQSLDAAITFPETERAKQTKVEVLSSVESILKHEKPWKQIQLPHDGALCVGDNFALIKNQTDYTMVRFEDNSMSSISLQIFEGDVHCWSSYYNGYFSMNIFPSQQIQFLPVLEKNRQCTMNTDNGGKPIDIACFIDRLLLVRDAASNQIIIEEWRLINKCTPWEYSYGSNGRLSIELVTRWRPPLSCPKDESIKKIAFNHTEIVLAINNSKMSPINRLEFRTRGMMVLGYIPLDENIDFPSMSLVSITDGWILGWKKIQNKQREYTFIDKNFHEHEQKILSSGNIKNIIVFDEPPYRPSLAVYVKMNYIQTAAVGNQKFVLYLYEMQDKPTIKSARKK